MDYLSIEMQYKADATALMEQFAKDSLDCQISAASLASQLYIKITELQKNRDWAFKVIGYNPITLPEMEIDFNLNFEEPTT